MRVLIDADGCPVVNIALQLCRRTRIDCLIFCDTAHEFSAEGAQTLVFDKGADSVDYAIASRVLPGDIVITQDYGLASLCLARGAQPVHQDGWAYTPDNIDALLLVRHESAKARATGKRIKGPRKRTDAQNRAFQTYLSSLLGSPLQG